MKLKLCYFESVYLISINKTKLYAEKDTGFKDLFSEEQCSIFPVAQILFLIYN